jgi:hypothetical protein
MQITACWAWLSSVSLVVGLLWSACCLHAADAPPMVLTVSGEVLHADTIEIAGFRLRDVIATPRTEGDEVQFFDIQAKAYGGTASGIVGFNLGGSQIRARIDLKDVDLDAILSQWRGNPAGLVGRVSGWMAFTMPADRPDQVEGSGAIHVEQANLLQLPLLTVLLAGDPTAGRNLDVLDLPFSLSDGKIHIQEGQLASPSAGVRFTGSVGLDGSLNLALVPTFSFNLLDRIWGVGTLMTPVLSIASSRLARAVVRGRLSEPVLILDPFGTNRD